MSIFQTVNRVRNAASHSSEWYSLLCSRYNCRRIYMNKIENTNLSQCRSSSIIKIEILRYRSKINTTQICMTAHSPILLQVLQKERRCLTSYLLYFYNYIRLMEWSVRCKLLLKHLKL